MTVIAKTNIYSKNIASSINFYGVKNKDDNKTSVPNLPKDTEKTLDAINNTIETEKNKKSNKLAIVAGCTAVVISGIVFLFNPKYSKKFLSNLEITKKQLAEKIEKSKDNFVKTSLYKFGEKVLNFATRGLNLVNNGNSIKDLYFKKLCTGYAEIKTDDNFFIKAIKNIKNFCIKITKPFHEKITEWGDKIGRYTVKKSYKNAVKKMDAFEDTINRYKDKLSTSERQSIESKLEQIRQMKSYYSESEVDRRLIKQGSVMNNLENDVQTSFKNFCTKLKNKDKNLGELFDFWAQDSIKTQSAEIEKAGNKEINKLIGKEEEKGLYNEIAEIFNNSASTSISDADKKFIENSLRKVDKQLKKANNYECVEYLDKKRDLLLGSAPTDVVTTAGTIALSGVAIGTADTKKERESKAITLGFPAVIGAGTNILLTSMLVSGGKGIMLSGIISAVISKLGSIINHRVFNNNIDEESENKVNDNKGHL